LPRLQMGPNDAPRNYAQSVLITHSIDQ
jgi:hypothetical protein